MPKFQHCLLCGDPFIASHPTKRYCCAQHAVKAANIRYRARGKQKIADARRITDALESNVKPILRSESTQENPAEDYLKQFISQDTETKEQTEERLIRDAEVQRVREALEKKRKEHPEDDI